MKKTYSGLDAIKVSVDAKDQICASGGGGCLAIVTLTMENYVCVDPDWMKQVEYIGDQA